MFQADNSLSLTAQLRPPAESLTANLDFTVWLLRTTVNTVFNEAALADQTFPLLVRETLNLSEKVALSQELRFSYGQSVAQDEILTQSLTTLRLWDFSASFTAGLIQPRRFNTSGLIWEDDGPNKAFLPSLVTMQFNHTTDERLRWKNRIRTKASVNTSWSMNIEEFTNNRFDLSFTYSFLLHEMLEISIKTSSYNEATFLYFDSLASQVGVDTAYLEKTFLEVLLEDLFKSLNFFNRTAREESNFKLGSISVDAVHHLHDWDLILSYQGSPTLENQSYGWQSTFSILLKWLPIPELRSNIRGEVSPSSGAEFSLRG
jgi:hypothetical protein